MKKIFFSSVLFILLPFQKVSAQWAGSVSNADTEKKADFNSENTDKSNNPYFGIGFGIFGYGSNVFRANASYNFASSNYGALLGNATDVKYLDEGVALNLHFNQCYPTVHNPLQLGYEIGGGYMTQEVSYKSAYRPLNYGEITSGWCGVGLCMRYNIVKSEHFDLYAQATYGLGFLSLQDDHSNDLLFNESFAENFYHYGGYSAGIRLGVFFVEYGYNTQGTIRFGFMGN